MNNNILDRLDRLLTSYFRQPAEDGSRLNRLESDVWRKINLRKADSPVGLFEQILAFIFQPQYRFAPVTAALLIGLMAGNMTTMQSEIQISSASALNFEVFSPSSQHLISTNLNRNL